MTGKEEYFIAFEDNYTGDQNVNTGLGFINYEVEPDWSDQDNVDALEPLYYSADERFRGKKQIDVNQLNYSYQWFVVSL